ncbi:uncharacterized protein LOC113153119 isoform X2 [Anabas testudineus]|nr:uncharacterized protein LOC113153119 isoform X2 [Anabas testudineus]
MEMPKTKQSSISAFFTSQRRVLNKKSLAEEPKTDPVHSLCSSGAKRRRETDVEEPNVYISKPGVDHDRLSENVTEPKPVVWQEHDEGSHTPCNDVYFESEEEQFEGFNPPQSKKRFTDSSLLAADSQPLPQAWSQDPLLILSQYSDSEYYLTSQKNTTAKNVNNYEPSFLNSEQSEEAFGFHVGLEGRTSTQKHLSSSQMDDEKENSRALPSNSPSKHSSFSHVNRLSNHKWTDPKTVSHPKHLADHIWKRADKEESYNSQFMWTKPKGSPLKKRAPELQSREADEDSLAMLFTQDSEGFRVIAHRGLQTRSPLKDHTNVSTGLVRTGAYKSLVDEDEEDDMLFTQDSQGNVVIKH